MDSYVMRITELKIPMLKKLDITIKKFGAVLPILGKFIIALVLEIYRYAILIKK